MIYHHRYSTKSSVCFFPSLLYKQEQGKENKGQGQGIGKGKREPWRKTEDRGQPTTPAIEAVRNSVWCYDGPKAQEKRKPQVPAPMLGYLQTWRTHLNSHFDIPGSLEEDSNQLHTALGKFDRKSYWVIDFLRDKAQLAQITDPRTGDMSPLETRLQRKD